MLSFSVRLPPYIVFLSADSMLLSLSHLRGSSLLHVDPKPLRTTCIVCLFVSVFHAFEASISNDEKCFYFLKIYI